MGSAELWDITGWPCASTPATWRIAQFLRALRRDRRPRNGTFLRGHYGLATIGLRSSGPRVPELDRAESAIRASECSTRIRFAEGRQERRSSFQIVRFRNAIVRRQFRSRATQIRSNLSFWQRRYPPWRCLAEESAHRCPHLGPMTLPAARPAGRRRGGRNLHVRYSRKSSCPEWSQWRSS